MKLSRNPVGALGIRTTHQQEAKAQLTVRCEFRGSAPSYTADKTDAIIKVSDTEDTGDILSSVKLEDSAGKVIARIQNCCITS